MSIVLTISYRVIVWFASIVHPSRIGSMTGYWFVVLSNRFAASRKLLSSHGTTAGHNKNLGCRRDPFVYLARSTTEGFSTRRARNQSIKYIRWRRYCIGKSPMSRASLSPRLGHKKGSWDVWDDVKDLWRPEHVFCLFLQSEKLHSKTTTTVSHRCYCHHPLTEESNNRTKQSEEVTFGRKRSQ